MKSKISALHLVVLIFICLRTLELPLTVLDVLRFYSWTAHPAASNR